MDTLYRKAPKSQAYFPAFDQPSDEARQAEVKPDAEPVSAICPVCDERTSERRHGLTWCDQCSCGWTDPATFAVRRRLRPFEARQQLHGRSPWGHQGKPNVIDSTAASRKGGRQS